MSELDNFVQPDLTMTIDLVTNNNYKVIVNRPPTNRGRTVDFPSDIVFETLQEKVVNLRSELEQWAKKYDELLDPDKRDGLSCAPERVRPLWDFLANWGRNMYMELFNILESRTTIAQLAETIKGFKDDAQIRIDSPMLVIPWGMLYDEKLPATDDPSFVDKFLKHFWGFRYQIELQAPTAGGDYGNDYYVNLHPYLDNTENTRLTAAINKTSDDKYKTGQITFFKALAQRFNFSNDSATPIVPEINECRETVIKSMMERKEPQHLFYFYCHHAKGEGVTTKYGSKDYIQRTRIMMDGETEGEIYLEELKRLRQDNKITNFTYPPLIFLNACNSGQLEMGNPAGFMEYFIKDLRSIDYIGTEATVPALFADEYGKRFVEQFFQAKSVGKILLDLNRYYAKQYCNPFGLYYSLFGLAQLKLNKSVEEIKQ